MYFINDSEIKLSLSDLSSLLVWIAPEQLIEPQHHRFFNLIQHTTFITRAETYAYIMFKCVHFS